MCWISEQNISKMILEIAGSKNSAGQYVLAADIGATKTNIAICHWDGAGFFIEKEAAYKTKNFSGIGSLINEFVGNTEMPGKISLAVAGPVQDDKVTLTNINWQIDGRETSRDLKRPVLLINDLEAAAYGLAVLNDRDIHCLHPGAKNAKGNVAIIAPGTGLGEAGLYFDGNNYHPFATEGGHSSFAPRTNMDIELYQFLRKSFEHVSWERLVSGPGICAVYDFLVHVKEREEPAWIREKMLVHDKATVISENAGECDVCKETMDLFVRYLAEESASLVLKLKATGGLFIGGGIVPHLIHSIHEDYFLKYFSGFGRMKNLLQSVPVNILLNKKVPLLGAAYFATRQPVNLQS